MFYAKSRNVLRVTLRDTLRWVWHVSWDFAVSEAIVQFQLLHKLNDQ